MNGPPLCSIGDDCRGQDLAGNQIPPRDVWDNGYLCGGCRRRLLWWIQEMPILYEEIAQALIPQGGSGGGIPSYRNAWAINPALLGELRYDFDIWGKLAGWARIVVEERGLVYPGIATGDVARLANWYSVHIDWIAHQQWAEAMYLEIGELRRDARRVAYPDRRRKRFRLPAYYRCPEPDCGGDMYAIVTSDNHSGTMIQCSVCGQEWIPMQWFRLGRRILNTPQEVSA